MMEQKLLPIEQVEYTHDDFKFSASEQIIELHHAKKTHFDDALQFWVHSLRSQDWRDLDYLLRYAHNSTFRPMTNSEFSRFILGYTKSLSSPLRLTPKGGFIWAMQMYDAWNDVAVVAEFSEEYVSFYWSTTA